MRAILILTILLCAAPALADRSVTIEINSQRYVIPVDDGFCAVVGTELTGSGLVERFSARLRDKFIPLALLYECDLAGNLDDGSLPPEGRYLIWGLVAQDGVAVPASDMALLTYQTLFALTGRINEPGQEENRRAFMDRILQPSRDRNFEVTCSDVYAVDESVGGKGCFRRETSGETLSLDIAGAVRILNGRFVTAVAAMMPSNTLGWPEFEDAVAMLGSLKPVD